MNKLVDLFLDLVFPTKCILCREFIGPGKPRICPECQNTMPMTEKGSTRKGDFFSGCVSALYYEGRVRDAIRRYKFGGAQAYSNAFGELVAERIYEQYGDDYDIITWVPLSPDRRRRRGYDQTQRIAGNTARRLNRKLVRTLRKRRGVKPQSVTGSPERRKANIAGAYRVIDPQIIQGRRILLIDDIITSGSTLSECAKTLLLAGAEEVLCASLARTP